MMENFCARCTAKFKTEKYWLFGMCFCRACMDTIKNDPDYAFIFIRLNKLAMKQALSELRNIEN